jgi:threonine dehydrogenase-like Zn-dependent dehydrogenase
MKALRFVISVPRYVLDKALGPLFPGIYTGPLSMLRYAEVPEPALPGPDWVRIRTRYAGICGSDLHQIHLDDSPYVTPFASPAFIVGHENVGVVEEVGAAIGGIQVGDRVVADPVLACPARGIEPLCAACQQGEYPRCENFAEGKLAPGVIIGSCADTGGTWSPSFVAHRFQLFRIPDRVSDENAAVVDAFCSSLHPVMRVFPRDTDTVLVLGVGVIGIGVVAALRVLGSQARIVVLAQHRFQGEMARRYGANEVIYTRDGDPYEALARVLGARLYRPALGKRVVVGGADVVYECVGRDDTVDDALRFTRAGGRMALVGLIGTTRKVDWTSVWFKELTVVGTNSSSSEDYLGQRVRGYQLALNWMAEGKLDLTPLLTHTFPLEEYRRAIEVTSHKARYQVIKSAFRFP